MNNSIIDKQLIRDWYNNLSEEESVKLCTKHFPYTPYIDITWDMINVIYLSEHPQETIKEAGNSVEGYTKGVWEVGKTAFSEKTSLWVGATLIATMADVPHEGSEANAKRIVECVNGWDELRQHHAENAVKLTAYQIKCERLEEENRVLKEENENLKKMEQSFYVHICRAYNAGKHSMNLQHKDAREQGKEHFNDNFLSSHDYFVNESPSFTVNVP